MVKQYGGQLSLKQSSHLGGLLVEVTL